MTRRMRSGRRREGDEDSKGWKGRMRPARTRTARIRGG